MKLFMTAVILTLSTVYLTAQQDSILVQEVSITATRIPMESYKTGRSVEIITAQQISQQPITSVDELLRNIVGVNINSRSGFGVQADIGIRGSTYSQVLVLIDNVRFNDPLTAHFNNNIPVALADIDQIEIIKGPAGASYGSDAVGGLIHIKTKSYTGKQGERPVNLQANLGTGQYGYFASDVGASYHTDKLHLGASFKTSKAAGQTFRNPNFDLGVSENENYNNHFDLQTYSASLAYKLNDDLRIYIRGGYDVRDFSAKYFYTNSSFDESTEVTDNHWGLSALNYSKGKSDIELNLGYKVSDDFFLFNPAFPPNDHEMKQTVINFNHNYKLSNKTSLAYGAQYINKDVVSTDRGSHNNSSFGVYGIVATELADNLHLNTSLRLENDENFGTELLPQLSLSYKAENYILRSSYGRAVRAADYTERYVSFLIPNLTPGRNIGNPDLKAEKSNSFDLGIDIFSGFQTTLSATAFLRSSTNLIDFSSRNASEINNIQTLQENENYFYADNVAESNVLGIELSAKKIIPLDQHKLTANFGYTYLKSSAANGLLSRYISNHPRSNFNLVLDLELGSVHLSSTSNYIVRQEETNETIGAVIPENYFVTNLKASYNLSQSFKFYLQALNVTDTRYEEILGSRMPGRWISFGAQFVLDPTGCGCE